MAINKELLNIQTKIGNSFLRAFYPIDYRSNQNVMRNIDELLNREVKGLRTLSSTTSLVSQKIGNALTSLSAELDELRDSQNSLQEKIRAGEDTVGKTASNAESASNALLDFLVAGGLEALTSLRNRTPRGGPNTRNPTPPPKPPDTPEEKAPKNKSKFKLPKGLGIIALAYELWNVWGEIEALDTNMKKGEYRQAVAQIVSRAVASIGLMWVGAFLGAMVGGALGFGVGAIPGFIAGLIGGVVADYTLGDTVDQIVDGVVDYLYTGDEEEEAEAEELAASESSAQMREPVAPTPSLEPVQATVSEQTAQVPLAPPLVGPTPPTPPTEQIVDSPVTYPGPVEAADLSMFGTSAMAATTYTANAAVNEVMNRASSLIPVATETEAQNKIMEDLYGPNRPAAPPGLNRANDNQATISTGSNQAGGIEVQPAQGIGSVQVIEAYGPGRPGRPVQAIRDIAVRAAETVGMTQIKFTSGVGDYISPERKARGQKTTKHSEGIALDVTGFASQAQRVAFMQTARQLGAGGIGAYNNGSVHIDLGPPRVWDGAVGVPGLADGGRVSKPTLALIGEGGEPEYVVPQSKAIKFAHEMIAARPSVKTKKHTHVLVVPILT